jgi:hypothetical protein
MNNEKSALKSAMLTAISDELDLWLAKESNIGNSYDYENEFLKTTRSINRILFSKSLGEISSNRNKKNSIPVLAKLK